MVEVPCIFCSITTLPNIFTMLIFLMEELVMVIISFAGFGYTCTPFDNSSSPKPTVLIVLQAEVALHPFTVTVTL